jgi:hypothetical protein
VWFYIIQTWLPLLNHLTAAISFQAWHHSSWDRQGFAHKLNVIMQNRSTPEYWLEKGAPVFSAL